MVISLVCHKHATLWGYTMMISTFWGQGWVEIWTLNKQKRQLHKLLFIANTGNVRSKDIKRLSHTKGTTKHGQFLITFPTELDFKKRPRIPQVTILFPLTAIKIQGMSITQKHEINALMIIAVKEAAYAVAKRKPEKISGSLGFEPWPVWYRCSAPKKWNYICCIIMSAKNAWSV